EIARRARSTNSPAAQRSGLPAAGGSFRQMRDSGFTVNLKLHSSVPGFSSASLQRVAISPSSLSEEGEARVAFQMISSEVSDRSLERSWLQLCLPANAARASSLGGAARSLQ